MMAAPESLVIREPRASEYAACRMLLPEISADPTGRCTLLAFNGTGQSIVGAVSYRDDGKALSGLRLHVIHTRRRTGIGSRLLDYAAEQARRLGRNKVAATVDLKIEPEAEAFLNANGFEKTVRLTIVEGALDDVITPWRAQRNRAKDAAADLPPGARFVGMDEAPMDQIVALYAEHIAEIPLVPGVRRLWRLERYTESAILMIGDKVVGVMLAEITGDRLRFPAWIVVPEYRGKLIGALLRVAALDRIEPRLHEVKRIQYEFLDKAQATAKIAREAGYEVVSIAVRFDRALA